MKSFSSQVQPRLSRSEVIKLRIVPNPGPGEGLTTIVVSRKPCLIPYEYCRPPFVTMISNELFMPFSSPKKVCWHWPMLSLPTFTKGTSLNQIELSYAITSCENKGWGVEIMIVAQNKKHLIILFKLAISTTVICL